ncbi:hypothetical protein D3C87_1510560 [compost metagenome]
MFVYRCNAIARKQEQHIIVKKPLLPDIHQKGYIILHHKIIILLIVLQLLKDHLQLADNRIVNFSGYLEVLTQCKFGRD